MSKIEDFTRKELQVIAAKAGDIPGVKMLPVQSSNGQSIGYSPETRTLFMKFPRGVTYMYSDVPPEKWGGLRRAKHKGTYFKVEIWGKYKEEVEER